MAPIPKAPKRKIRGDSLRKLIEQAKKLPTKPTGGLCQMVRTNKASKGGNGYTHTMKLDDGLFVQCFGECAKPPGSTCTLGIVAVWGSDEKPSDAGIVITCSCLK